MAPPRARHPINRPPPPLLDGDDPADEDYELPSRRTSKRRHELRQKPSTPGATMTKKKKRVMTRPLPSADGLKQVLITDFFGAQAKRPVKRRNFVDMTAVEDESGFKGENEDEDENEEECEGEEGEEREGKVRGRGRRLAPLPEELTYNPPSKPALARAKMLSSSGGNGDGRPGGGPDVDEVGQVRKRPGNSTKGYHVVQNGETSVAGAQGLYGTIKAPVSANVQVPAATPVSSSYQSAIPSPHPPSPRAPYKSPPRDRGLPTPALSDAPPPSRLDTPLPASSFPEPEMEPCSRPVAVQEKMPPEVAPRHAARADPRSYKPSLRWRAVRTSNGKDP